MFNVSETALEKSKSVFRRINQNFSSKANGFLRCSATCKGQPSQPIPSKAQEIISSLDEDWKKFFLRNPLINEFSSRPNGLYLYFAISVIVTEELLLALREACDKVEGETSYLFIESAGILGLAKHQLR
jgi:hypothetical protein